MLQLRDLQCAIFPPDAMLGSVRGMPLSGPSDTGRARARQWPFPGPEAIVPTHKSRSQSRGAIAGPSGPLGERCRFCMPVIPRKGTLDLRR
jgi:hypothetical protein